MTLADVLFASGRADLAPAAERVVRDICRLLQGPAAGARVAVAGYTDSTGTLARGKSGAVRGPGARRGGRLAACGVPAQRLTVQGHGQEHPVAPNETADGRSRNRRVEIVVKN